MSHELRIPKKNAGRTIKALTRQQTKAKVEAEVGVTGAMELIEKVEKELKAQKKVLKKLSGQCDKLWAWKIETELRRGKP